MRRRQAIRLSDQQRGCDSQSPIGRAEPLQGAPHPLSPLPMVPCSLPGGQALCWALCMQQNQDETQAKWHLQERTSVGPERQEENQVQDAKKGTEEAPGA